MTHDQFMEHYAITPAAYPNLAADTVLHANREIFARVADLEFGTSETIQAVKDATDIVIGDL